jgi:hypothetical protein
VSEVFWLADGDARVLGPVSLAVIRDLAARGNLGAIRSVSRDGKAFVPVREVDEVAEALASSHRHDEVALAQAQATQQILQWLDAVKDRKTFEIFRLNENASREAYRAAFFPLVHRYVPSRLPPEATDELRLACEEAFLFLAERMIEVEKQFKQPFGHIPTDEFPIPKSVMTVTPTPMSRASAISPSPDVDWRGGMVHARLSLVRGDTRPFWDDPSATWENDSLAIVSTERVMIGTPVEVSISFEGHVNELVASGRVVGLRTGYPQGFSVKLLDMTESQRAMVRAWVQRYK